MTTQIARKIPLRHMGYSFQSAARVLLYAPSHRQTHHTMSERSYHGATSRSRRKEGRKKGNVLFTDAFNTFYLRLYGVTHMVKDHSDSEKNTATPHGLLFPISSKGSFICTIPQTCLYNTLFHLTTHSTHLIYGCMASDIWLRTILIVRKETRCRHMGYSYRLTARVILYAPSHRQHNTYHGLCYTSRGALAGTRNSS